MSKKPRQLTSGDVTHIPFEQLPANVPVKPYSNKQGYQSWAETIKRIANTPADELERLYGDAVRNLGRYGNITLRELVVVRAFYEMAKEPNPALFGLIMDRSDGKVAQTVVSASGNVTDWMEAAKAMAQELGVPPEQMIDEVMQEASKLIDEYNKPPDVVEGEIVE